VLDRGGDDMITATDGPEDRGVEGGGPVAKESDVVGVDGTDESGEPTAAGGDDFVGHGTAGIGTAP
jgi:hypothetical protein